MPEGYYIQAYRKEGARRYIYRERVGYKRERDRDVQSKVVLSPGGDKFDVSLYNRNIRF